MTSLCKGWKSGLVALLLSGSAIGQTVDFTTPTDDYWQYPFNGLPGTRPLASCFSSLGTGIASFDAFNDRDGIFVIAWDTSTLIDPNQGPGAYAIESVTVTLTNESIASWPIDLTPDEWFTYDVNNDGLINGDGIPRGQAGDTDGESADADPGRAIELFGSGFGPVYTIETWDELDVYVGGRNSAPAERDPFPFVFDPNGAPLHVEDNVQAPVGFTPVPWAVGVPTGYEPNEANAPFPVTFEIDLDLSGGLVRTYFQEQLDLGRVVVSVTSLADTVQGGTVGGVPSFFTKEGLGLETGAAAPRLTIVLSSAAPGDVNDSGCVDLTDLAIVLSNFGATGVARADGDLTGDGIVDLSDLAQVLANFGSGC